jgi:hypothetical protein
VRVANRGSVDEKEDAFGLSTFSLTFMCAPGPAILSADVDGRIRWDPREAENVFEFLFVFATEKDIVVNEREAICLDLAGKRDGRK